MLRLAGMRDATIRAAIQQDLRAWDPAWGDQAAWADEIAWSLTANIDSLTTGERLRACYSPTRGRPSMDPAQLIRALGLMTVRATPSLVQLRHDLRQTPFLARLCGWQSPDHLPAIGTLYAFFRRLYPEAHRRLGAWRRPSGRRLKLKAGQKLPPRHPGAVDRVARRVAREAQRGPCRPTPGDVWDHWLCTTSCESVERGILPSTWHLAADGTEVESAASSFGNKRCQCRGNSCACLRWFSDPMALLGWDSHRNKYFYGYMPQAMTVVNAAPGHTSHPLIVSFALHPGNRNDAVAFPDLLVKTQALYGPDLHLPITYVLGDAACDANALWTFTRQRGVIPAFAPRETVEPAHVSAASAAAGITLQAATQQPVCAAGAALLCLGTRRLGVTVYACPLRQHRHATCNTPCAKAGKTVTVNSRGSRYADSGVPYGTPGWKALYAERTGVERAFSLWESQGLKQRCHRRPYLWYGRLALGAIVAHHQVSVRQAQPEAA